MKAPLYKMRNDLMRVIASGSTQAPSRFALGVGVEMYRLTSTEKEKAGLFLQTTFRVHTAHAVYCEFGDFSHDFVKPCQLDQSLNPNRKQVRESAIRDYAMYKKLVLA